MSPYDWVPIAVAAWGAVLSTALAVIKIWEFRQDRMRLTTSYKFTYDPQDTNEIIIENVSKTPVMVSYWELLWLQRRWGRDKITYGKFPDEGYCNLTIAPHSRHVLSFDAKDELPWSKSAAKMGVLFLKLHIAGRRRPVWLKVYDPNE